MAWACRGLVVARQAQLRFVENGVVTMGRDHVKVCVRTRPTSTFAQDAIVIDREAQVRTYIVTRSHLSWLFVAKYTKIRSE